MNDKMSIKWEDVFTQDACPECNGDGMSNDLRLYEDCGDTPPACEKCHGVGRMRIEELYHHYMDECNYRAGLD